MLGTFNEIGSKARTKSPTVNKMNKVGVFFFSCFDVNAPVHEVFTLFHLLGEYLCWNAEEKGEQQISAHAAAEDVNSRMLLMTRR